MMKRIIALLLALILTVGLLPTVALAAGETANTDVKSGSIGEDGKWTTAAPDQSNKPEGVETVSKTAKPTSNPNEYEVKLKVVLKQTSETKTGAAATALVLDCSGSMDWCTECGRDWCRHKTDDTYNVTFDVHNSNSYYVFENGKYVRVSYCDGYHFLNSCDGGAGWYTSDRKRDHKSQNKLTPKISQTDSAATHVQFYTRTEGSFDTSRMTAAKNAAKNFLKTYSGFDASAINDDGTLKQSAENLSIKRYVAVIRFSKNIDNDTDSSYWGDYKPAWYDVSTKDGYGKVLATINNASAGGGTNLDAGLTTASSLMDANLVKNLTSKNVIALTDGAPTYSKSYGDGGSTNQDICNETAKTAETLRVKSKVYTVCFAAESDPLYNGGGTVGDFLKNRIATQPAEGSNEKYAYNAKSAEDLIKVFKDITDTIVSGLNNGTVKDSLPAGITSTDFGNATQFELNDQKQFHKDVKTETVDGKEVTTYTYTKTYTVTINPDNENLVKTADGYAPLNGETTLTVEVDGKKETIPFPIPAGKVTPKQYTVTGTIDNKGTVNSAASPYTETVESGKTSKAMTFVPATGYVIDTITEKIGTDEPTSITVSDANKNSYTYDAKTVTADITVTVTTKKRTDLSYTVKYVDKDTNAEIRQSETTSNQQFEAEIDVASMDKLPITGYTYNSCSPTDKLTIGTGENVIILYYTRNEYKVTYEYTGDIPTNPAPTPVPSEATCKYEANVMIAAAPAPVSGYTFEGWKREDGTAATNFTMPANDVKITGNWKKNGDGTYKLEYWLEKLDGTYENTETITGRTGTIGTTASVTEADKKQITGFTFDANNTNNKLEGEIVSGDPLTLKLYYKRNTYKVTYDYGTAPSGASTLPTEATYKYGATVTVADKATAPGYNFDGWKKDGTVTTSFEMPAQNVTLTGSWTLKDPTAVNVDLNNHIYKTFTSDTADIPNGKLTFNVTVRGISDNAASMTRSGSVEFTKQDVEGVTTSKAFTFAGNPLTFTAAGEYTFEVVEDTTTTINGLTYNVNNEAHLFTIVVDKKENANELYVKEVRVGTAEYTGNALTATLAYATITNNYVEPKNAQVTNKEVVVTQPEDALKTAVYAFKITSGVTVLYPTGNGTTSNTLEVPYGTTEATLLYKITVFAGTKTYYEFDDVGAELVYAEHANVVQENNTFKVTFEDGAEYAYVYVAVTHGLNFDNDDNRCTVDNTVLGQKAETTVKEKDPNSVDVDFSRYVYKKLTVTGDKAFTGATFEATLDGTYYPPTIINSLEDESAIATYAHAVPGAAQLHKTLTVSFDANDDLTQPKPFLGTINFNAEGTYEYTLKEVIPEGATGYDTSEFHLVVTVEANGNGQLEATVSMWFNDELMPLETGILFSNTIDTGKDDYYPIIIPTIINKDTGMLNKTDHFAYVIGYPDGTVHPNGQITRAEVATIFFRLLRDEVRDGAFTTSNTYSDVAYGKWYNNPISTMSALGIITGYPDGTFKPNKPITRAEFAAIAARFDETQSGKSATFSDVIGHWAAKEIGIAYYNDWIKGYPDGTFKPDQNITRAEAMTLINRVLERKPESPADLLTNMNKWTDNMDTSKWYYLDVQEATNSHGYTRKTFNYELWRQMLPDPDWSRYER